jgi:hypothetical protein
VASIDGNVMNAGDARRWISRDRENQRVWLEDLEIKCSTALLGVAL